MGFIKHLLIFVIAGLLISGVSLFLWIRSLPIPDFETFDERKIIQSTKIYDRTGKHLLYDVHENIKRTVISYKDIPRYVKNATVVIEDDSFYQHKGVSIVGITRAFLTNMKQGRLRGQGGSTITQQLAKNTFLTPEKTFARKIKELFLSLKLERVFTKEEILTLYLNEIPYGGVNYGIEAASQSFFGKSARELTLAEAAFLAALPQSPTYYSPYGAHKDELEDRKNFILEKMFKLGFIEQEEFEKAKEENVIFASPAEKGIRAPHFVLYIKAYLEKKYGKDLVELGGLKVITTLNLELQTEAEKMTKEYAKEIEEKFDAKNAGLVGIDPKTGQILVMVGSKDYFSEDYEGKFNVTLAKRQPGSSFKPFVYATAFKKGYTPETTVFDLETEFNSSCNPDGTPIPGTNTEPDECYTPGNYDNIFRGPVSLRNALAQSINIPSVKILYLAGIKESIETAKSLGITTITDPLRYGLTLVLGGGEVTLLEITGAYSVFANDGVKNTITGVIEVKDSKGEIIEEYKETSVRVLDQETTRKINDILSDNNARAPAFGQQSWLYFSEREVAVKTGTTNDYRDAWVIGHTPNFALGLWVGNNDNTSMKKKVAGFIAAPLWNDFLKKVFENLPEENFPKTEQEEEKKKPVLNGFWQGGKIYLTDKITNKLATEFTPPELIKENVLTQIHSILYWINKDDPEGIVPKNPEKDPQFNLWEIPVRKWVEQQGIKEETKENIPVEYDDVHKPEYAPKINIKTPLPNTILKEKERLIIEIEEKSHFPLEQVSIYLGDNYLGSFSPPTYKTVVALESIIFTEEQTKLKLVVYDKMRNKNEYIVPLNTPHRHN